MPRSPDPAPLKEAPDRAASPSTTLHDTLDDRLDEALEESFPASDPIAVHRPETRP